MPSHDVRNESGENVLIALEGPPDVVATTKRTITVESVTKEARTEQMDVMQLLNPGKTTFPPNISRTSAAKKAQKRDLKQKQYATKGKSFAKHVGK